MKADKIMTDEYKYNSVALGWNVNIGRDGIAIFWVCVLLLYKHLCSTAIFCAVSKHRNNIKEITSFKLGTEAQQQLYMDQFLVSVEEDRSLTQKLLGLEYVVMARGHCFL